MRRWFGQKVTLKRQLTGLESLPALVRGCRVADLGCAEGLIGAQCRHWGASFVLGVEKHEHLARYARRILSRSVCADLDEYTLPETFDVVLLLGVLNKLREPGEVLARALDRCRQTCVVRLSGHQWPRLVTGHCPEGADLLGIAERCGFALTEVRKGPSDVGRGVQFVGYLTRCAR